LPKGRIGCFADQFQIKNHYWPQKNAKIAKISFYFVFFAFSCGCSGICLRYVINVNAVAATGTQ
jgi:hypothetical protein